MIVAALTGAAVLLMPNVFGKSFGYVQAPADLTTVLRSYGALQLVFGGLTSLLASRAKSWDRVEIIVLAEIAYTAVATVLYVLFLATGAGPVLGNTVFLILTAALLVLFWMSWKKRPA
jgi:hypothetical protein